MLENDPPSGTPVRFVRSIKSGLRTAEAYSKATLKRPIGVYSVESPDDLFEVIFDNESMIVKRADIEKA